MKLEGRVALVTGGGSGIGRAIATLFADEGAQVIVNDIVLENAEKTVQEMAVRERGLAIRADVSSSSEVKAMFAQVADRFATLDILVNNAGIAETNSQTIIDIGLKARARLKETMSGDQLKTHWDITQGLGDEEWHRMIGVHLNGTFFCTREALKLMAQENRGAIINMSAVAALAGLPMSPHYGAAKAGILGFTRSVAHEVASRNIRVNAICPGWVDTPMMEEFPRRFRALTTSNVPLGRWGEPREIATTALFLACDDSSYYTGQWLSPNGGLFIG
jgi:3-oxoacyl-[acyl-carrier protein] reductase